SLHRLALGGIAIANGTAFSPDGRTLYYCDSPTHVIRRCRYTRAGEVRDPCDWIDLTHVDGEPDGSTVDAAGGVWNARWDAGEVVRYDTAGHITDIVTLSVSRPTRPALGGLNLDTLFVTSAQPDSPGNTADTEDGHVFAAHADIAGLPEARFAGTPLRHPHA
ncbi:SMP-30/gluconolaconase/LRE domain-containing protein, partial [mine drainage metagenome]